MNVIITYFKLKNNSQPIILFSTIIPVFLAAIQRQYM